MRGGEVADVNMVADAGAVRRWVVISKDMSGGAFSERRFAGDLDEMCSAGGRRPARPRGVRSRNIEIA